LALETARDVISQLAGFEGKMKNLPPHAFEKHIHAPEPSA
jgi:hypothetical protein